MKTFHNIRSVACASTLMNDSNIAFLAVLDQISFSKLILFAKHWTDTDFSLLAPGIPHPIQVVRVSCLYRFFFVFCLLLIFLYVLQPVEWCATLSIHVHQFFIWTFNGLLQFVCCHRCRLLQINLLMRTKK